MSSDWQEVKLSEIADFQNGYSFSSREYVPKSSESKEVFRMGYIQRGGGFKEDDKPVYAPLSSKGSDTRYCLEEGDIVIAMTDMKDRVAILANCAQIPSSERFLLNQRVGRIRSKNRELADQKYLYYFMNSPPQVQYLRSMANRGVQVNLTTSAIVDSLISLPSVGEQMNIAHILGTLDEKIELNKKTKKTLEGIAKTLFKSWFVDFDPVIAKAEGRPTELSDEFSDLFPDSFEDSELGEIPSGWTIAEVSDLVDFQNGFAFKSSDWQDDGVPVVKIGSVKPGIVDLSNVSYVSDQVAAVADRYRLSSGDILIGMTGYVGEVGLVPLGTEMPLLNQRVGKISPLDPHLREFVYCLSRSTDFKEKVEQLSHGSAQANVSSKSICGIQTPLPTRDLLSLYSATTEPLLSRFLFCHRESEILSSLRDALLPRLISGELRVPDAEKMLEEVGI